MLPLIDISSSIADNFNIDVTSSVFYRSSVVDRCYWKRFEKIFRKTMRFSVKVQRRCGVDASMNEREVVRLQVGVLLSDVGRG